MRFQLRTLVVGLGLFLASTLGVVAGEADWFSQNGFTILEAVGSSDLGGFVLVGSDPGGAYHVLAKGDRYGTAFRVDAIGAEQVKVLPTQGEPAVAPILHRNIPPDVFLMAMAMVLQRSIVIGGSVDTLQPASPELLSDPGKLAEYCKTEGLDLRVFDDCILVRKGTFEADLTPFQSAEPQVATTLKHLRSNLPAVAKTLAEASSMIIEPSRQSAEPLTVLSVGLSAQALAYYIEKATDVPVSVKPPPPPPAEVVAAAPVAPAPARPKATDKLKALMAKGDFLAAARLSKALIQKYPTHAKLYNAYGVAVWKLGHRAMAIKAWQKALIVEPGNAYAQKMVAQVRQKLAAKN